MKPLSHQRKRLRSRTRDRAAELDQVAAIVHRLAVLLAAGVTPAAAWEYLGRDGAAVTRARHAGLGVPDAIRASFAGGEHAQAWAGVATVWDVATHTGAPLASTLREQAASLRGAAAVEREVATALAGPTSTARIVLALPVLGILFGAALGFDSPRILFTTSAGIGCLLVGIVLVVFALAWIRSLVRAARRRDANPGLRLDLMAIAVSGGSSLDRAARAVDAALEASGISVTADRGQVDEILDLASRAGVPAAELLRSQAQEVRRAAASSAQRRAAILAVRLVLPLGVCILPAFMALGVVPLLIAVISSTALGFSS